MKKTSILAAAALSLCTLYSSGTLALDGAELYKLKVCNTCHGPTGHEPIMPLYPKIAGQNAPYLLEQMKDIRDGKRTNGLSIAMKGVVAGVTDEEFQAIADWLAAN